MRNYGVLVTGDTVEEAFLTAVNLVAAVDTQVTLTCCLVFVKLCCLIYYYYIRLTVFYSRTTSVGRHQKGKPFWILLEQEMMGWQWHQLDHMQIICTLLQTGKHASTLPLSVYRPDALPAAQPTASKH